MIVPTIGRVVHVFRNEAGTPPEPALICYVHSDRKINVGGFTYTGEPFALRDLILLQDDDTAPDGFHAKWMPWQIEQGAKASALIDAVAQAESAAAVPAAVAPKTRSKVAPTSDAPVDPAPVDPAAPAADPAA